MQVHCYVCAYTFLFERLIGSGHSPLPTTSDKDALSSSSKSWESSATHSHLSPISRPPTRRRGRGSGGSILEEHRRHACPWPGCNKASHTNDKRMLFSPFV